MESRGPEDSKNVKTSQAYFFEGFISFFEDFSLTISQNVSCDILIHFLDSHWISHVLFIDCLTKVNYDPLERYL